MDLTGGRHLSQQVPHQVEDLPLGAVDPLTSVQESVELLGAMASTVAGTVDRAMKLRTQIR